MEVQVKSYGVYQILYLKGIFNDTDAQVLRATLENAFIANIPFLLLDCKEINGVSAAGLRLLLFYIQKFRETKVKLIMFHLPPDLQTLVTSCGFDSVVKITSTLAEALQIIKQEN